MAKNLYEAVTDYLNYMDHTEEHIQTDINRVMAIMPETPDVSDKIVTILEEDLLK